MTGRQQSDDMTPDGFSKFMRPSAERDELVRQLTTPINQPKKLPSEKLYTQCGACKGTGNQWDIDIKNIERAARQVRVDCRVCQGKGYMESGIHTGQVDKLMADKRNVDEIVASCDALIEEKDTVIQQIKELADAKLKECKIQEASLLGSKEYKDWKTRLNYYIGIRDVMQHVMDILEMQLDE